MARSHQPRMPASRLHERRVAVLRLLGMVVVLGVFFALVVFAGLVMVYR